MEKDVHHFVIFTVDHIVMDELQEFPHLVFCNGLSGHRVVDYHTSELETEGILHENVILDHTEDSELAEKEVKFFAKFSPAPPVLIHKLKLESPEEIADIFEISYEAACNAYFIDCLFRYSFK